LATQLTTITGRAGEKELHGGDDGEIQGILQEIVTAHSRGEVDAMFKPVREPAASAMLRPLTILIQRSPLFVALGAVAAKVNLLSPEARALFQEIGRLARKVNESAISKPSLESILQPKNGRPKRPARPVLKPQTPSDSDEREGNPDY
jgi:hypothetical protein